MTQQRCVQQLDGATSRGELARLMPDRWGKEKEILSGPFLKLRSWRIFGSVRCGDVPRATTDKGGSRGSLAGDFSGTSALWKGRGGRCDWAAGLYYRGVFWVLLASPGDKAPALAR